uniref:Uncharacterized protein n=1 Tax=viral metagenome TaxID=1070528 RepID=A0A6C0HFS0_9ZZZZ
MKSKNLIRKVFKVVKLTITSGKAFPKVLRIAQLVERRIVAKLAMT